MPCSARSARRSASVGPSGSGSVVPRPARTVGRDGEVRRERELLQADHGAPSPAAVAIPSFGEAIVVTQEVDDIIQSPIVKESIINNSDCKILLDQRKYMNKFDDIQTMLGLTDKEKGQVLSINMNNDPSRHYKEVWIGLGGTHSAVYATEVSAQEYLAYTTEETEKMEVMKLAAELNGNVEEAIKRIAQQRREK